MKNEMIDELTELFYELLDNWEQPFKGGASDGIHPKDVDEQELFLGFVEEVDEHGHENPYIAMKVALDHIVRDENYYSRIHIINNPVEQNISSREQLALICQVLIDELEKLGPKHNTNNVLFKLSCIIETPEDADEEIIRSSMIEGRELIKKYKKNRDE